ncbi:MAG: hypothetical protein V3R97_03705, partial [Gemmatimonadales bacterium]
MVDGWCWVTTRRRLIVLEEYMVGIQESATTEHDHAGHLREAGLRVTRPRLLVLDLLRSTPG